MAERGFQREEVAALLEKEKRQVVFLASLFPETIIWTFSPRPQADRHLPSLAVAYNCTCSHWG